MGSGDARALGWAGLSGIRVFILPLTREGSSARAEAGARSKIVSRFILFLLTSPVSLLLPIVVSSHLSGLHVCLDFPTQVCSPTPTLHPLVWSVQVLHLEKEEEGMSIFPNTSLYLTSSYWEKPQ